MKHYAHFVLVHNRAMRNTIPKSGNWDTLGITFVGVLDRCLHGDPGCMKDPELGPRIIWASVASTKKGSAQDAAY